MFLNYKNISLLILIMSGFLIFFINSNELNHSKINIKYTDDIKINKKATNEVEKTKLLKNKIDTLNYKISENDDGLELIETTIIVEENDTVLSDAVVNEDQQNPGTFIFTLPKDKYNEITNRYRYRFRSEDAATNLSDYSEKYEFFYQYIL